LSYSSSIADTRAGLEQAWEKYWKSRKENPIMTPEEIENELKELRLDIQALRTIEYFHAVGACRPTQTWGLPLTADQLNEYNSAASRLNDRYAQGPA
jgi:hypothetical protein